MHFRTQKRNKKELQSTKVSAPPLSRTALGSSCFLPGRSGLFRVTSSQSSLSCNKREKICEHHRLTRPRDSVTSAGSHKQTDRFLEALRTKTFSPHVEKVVRFSRPQATPLTIVLVLPVQERPQKCLVFSHRS